MASRAMRDRFGEIEYRPPADRSRVRGPDEDPAGDQGTNPAADRKFCTTGQRGRSRAESIPYSAAAEAVEVTQAGAAAPGGNQRLRFRWHQRPPAGRRVGAAEAGQELGRLSSVFQKETAAGGDRRDRRACGPLELDRQPALSPVGGRLRGEAGTADAVVGSGTEPMVQKPRIRSD